MIAGISDWLLSLPDWVALLIVFAAPALEASAFFGFLFPGEIAIFVGGVLSYQGRLELAPVMIAAVAGAIIGDTVGYWVGRRYGRRLLRFLFGRIPFVGRHLDRHLDGAQEYLQKRGGRAVFFGRYTAALRVLVPGLAGVSGMHYPKFLVWNVAGGATWAVAFVLLGYYAGEAWKKVERYAGRAGLVLLALIVGTFVVVRLVRRRQKEEKERVAAEPLEAPRPPSWFRRRFPAAWAWIGRRLDPARPVGLPLTTVAVIGGFCAYIFGAVTQDVVEHKDVTHLDPGVQRFFLQHRAETLTVLMKALTWLGSTVVIVPLLVVIGAYFLLRSRDWRPGLTLFAAYAGALSAYHILKPIVERPRPPLAHALVHASGFAFPSGHATMSVAFYGTLASLIWSRRSKAARVLPWVAATVIVFLIGVSRLYLGAHWLTDVLGGYALGGLWLSVVLAAVLVASGRRSRTKEPTPPPPELVHR